MAKPAQFSTEAAIFQQIQASCRISAVRYMLEKAKQGFRWLRLVVRRMPVPQILQRFQTGNLALQWKT
jgi:hypothetical protein